jgi:hypothetical protein
MSLTKTLGALSVNVCRSRGTARDRQPQRRAYLCLCFRGMPLPEAILVATSFCANNKLSGFRVRFAFKCRYSSFCRNSLFDATASEARPVGFIVPGPIPSKIRNALPCFALRAPAFADSYTGHVRLKRYPRFDRGDLQSANLCLCHAVSIKETHRG